MKRKQKRNIRISWIIGIIIIILLIFYFLYPLITKENQIQPYSIQGGNDYLGNNFSSIKNIGQTFSTISSCTPDNGYELCLSAKNDNGKASAKVNIMSTELKKANTYKNGYYVGDVKIPIKLDGDYLYLYDGKNINNQNELYDLANCDNKGCYNYDYKIISPDEILLASAGETYTGCPLFLGYDYDYEERSSVETTWWWDSWVVRSYGYLDINDNGKCLDLKSVECYDNNDCNENMYCNKEGEWNEWKCDLKECETGETSCDIFNYETCENNNWVNNGIIKNKCNVECIEDKHCNNDESEKYCENNNVVIANSTEKCNTQFYSCETNKEITIIETCEFSCLEGKCIESINESQSDIIIPIKIQSEIEKQSYTTMIYIIIGIMIGFGLIYMIISKN